MLTAAAAESQPPAEPESWEVSRFYDPVALRAHLLDYEVLPNPITVPAVRGKVTDPEGNPVAGAKVISHTPRHWVTLSKDLVIGEKGRSTRDDGSFSLPERTEPYRVLVAHESGVGSMSHEELIHADGLIRLSEWARLEGTLAIDGKPLPGQRIRLHANTLPWSYTRGGPRVAIYWETETDPEGRFVFDRAPPLGGLIHHWPDRQLGRGIPFRCRSGQTTELALGKGRRVLGRVALEAGVTVRSLIIKPPPISYPDDLKPQPGANREERRAWWDRVFRTAEGQRISDANFVRTNSSIGGSADERGAFTIHGVPSGDWLLTVYFEGERKPLEHAFHCEAGVSEPLDLGMLTR